MDIQWLLPRPQQMTETEKSSIVFPALRAGDLLSASVLEVEKGNDALLAFGRFKAYARLPLPVVSGQDIHIRVELAGQHLRLVMVPDNSKTVANNSADEPLALRLFEPIAGTPLLSAHARSLVPGESLQGRITGFEKDGLMLVDFGKFKAFAKVDIPVRPSQTIALTVTGTGDEVTLAVASKARPGIWTQPVVKVTDVAIPVHPAQTDAMVSSPGTHLMVTAAEVGVLRKQVQQMLNGQIQSTRAASVSLSAPLKGALANLTQVLNPVSPTGDKTTLVENIRAFVENSGIYFEKRLEQLIHTLQDQSKPMALAELAGHPAIRDLMVKDMKPNILILKEFINNASPDRQNIDRHLLETLKSVVGRTVDHIEQQQFSATEKPVHPDLLQAFSHLLLLADTCRNARLKVYYAKKGRDEEPRHPRVSLLLEMDRMGMVRTDLWMVGKDLNITFFVQEGETKAAIDAGHHRIKALLKDTFNTVAVSVVVNERKIVQFDGEELRVPSQRQVDLSI